MNKLMKYFFLVFLLAGTANAAMAQKNRKKTTTRKSTKRTTPKTTTAVIKSDTAVVAAAISDSLPIPTVKKSLRPDEAVDNTLLKERIPLPYENLRADDAVYRHKIWREIDAREKINLPFRYSADEDNGNQRFISILMKAIQDSAVTVFAPVDDRFTTPMTKAEVAKSVAGEPVTFAKYDADGNITGYETKNNDINLDSFYRFQIKEEVIFDKESSRLFFRILGIAPVKRVITSQGVDAGDAVLFWVYYPDMRETFAKYDVYNGKNYGARMSWEDLFESRMFHGRIIKSTIDNPYDNFIKNYAGIQDKPILQLLEGENMHDKIFNYEQDLWSY